jgi:hypothetical protein
MEISAARELEFFERIAGIYILFYQVVLYLDCTNTTFGALCRKIEDEANLA